MIHIPLDKLKHITEKLLQVQCEKVQKTYWVMEAWALLHFHGYIYENSA